MTELERVDHEIYAALCEEARQSGEFLRQVLPGDPVGVRQSDERIDYDTVAKLARQHRPKMIVVGYSAYSREIDFARGFPILKLPSWK